MNSIANAAPQGRVFVVGSSNTDLAVRTARLPLPGETVLGGALETYAGGKGANQAAAAAKCARRGVDVFFIGAFGDDDFGRARRKELEALGVNCAASVIKRGKPSGAALIGIGGAPGRKAENLILVAPGANAHLTSADVAAGLRRVRPGDIVLTQLEIPLPAVKTALQSARRTGALAALNPAPLIHPTLVKRLLPLTDFLLPNETEAAFLLGTCGVQALMNGRAKVKTPFAGHLVLTMGARGACWLQPSGERRLIPAPKVKPVDTVGAGDCFCGALAAELCGRDKPASNLETALRFAVAAASLKVTRPGAQAGIPRRFEVEKFLKKRR